MSYWRNHNMGSFWLGCPSEGKPVRGTSQRTDNSEIFLWLSTILWCSLWVPISAHLKRIVNALKIIKSVSFHLNRTSATYSLQLFPRLNWLADCDMRINTLFFLFLMGNCVWSEMKGARASYPEMQKNKSGISKHLIKMHCKYLKVSQVQLLHPPVILDVYLLFLFPVVHPFEQTGT